MESPWLLHPDDAQALKDAELIEEPEARTCRGWGALDFSPETMGANHA